MASAQRYWKGLFHCYEVDDLPRTNNGTEQFFGRVKRHERRVTGRKSTAGGPLETCAEFLLEAWDAILGLPNLQELLHEVTPRQLKEARRKLEALSEPARVKRMIQRNPTKFLKDALEAWRKA